MATKADKEEMQGYLDTLAPSVRRNVKVIDSDESSYKQMLHISMDTNIKKFVPIIGFRQAKSEDRTVPRVCVAPALMDCFYGYAAATDNFQTLASTGKEEHDNYRGGWKIYGFNYDLCLKPNVKLVYDAPVTNEHWLVGYSKDTAQYTPVYVGKVFFYSMKLIARDKGRPEEIIEFFIEIAQKEGMFLTGKKKLEKGFYKASGHWEDRNNLECLPISREEYEAAKKLSASLLSAPVEIPSSLTW